MAEGDRLINIANAGMVYVIVANYTKWRRILKAN